MVCVWVSVCSVSHITFRCVISIASSCLLNDGKIDIEVFWISYVTRASIQIIWNVWCVGKENIFFSLVDCGGFWAHVIRDTFNEMYRRKEVIFLAILRLKHFTPCCLCWRTMWTCNQECSLFTLRHVVVVVVIIIFLPCL